MTLTEWLQANPDWNQAKLAAEIDRSQGYVSMLCAGDLWPGSSVLLAVERVTGGAVTATDIACVHDAKSREKRETQEEAA